MFWYKNYPISDVQSNKWDWSIFNAYLLTLKLLQKQLFICWSLCTAMVHPHKCYQLLGWLDFLDCVGVYWSYLTDISLTVLNYLCCTCQAETALWFISVYRPQLVPQIFHLTFLVFFFVLPGSLWLIESLEAIQEEDANMHLAIGGDTHAVMSCSTSEAGKPAWNNGIAAWGQLRGQ